jgi:23S rRNA (guanosine2251-2'-O)-methyltransferase
MEELKEKGVWFIGTDAAGEQDFREVRYDTPIGLVIGSEGKGMGRLVRETCDFTVRLPMEGKVTSLNASVAGALMMFEVYRQRHPLSSFK